MQARHRLTGRSRAGNIVLALATALALGPAATAQYQAQDGWSKPRPLPEIVNANGIAIDPEAGVVYAANDDGLLALPLDGSPSRRVVEQQGIKSLGGLASPWGTALTWTQRSLTTEDITWVWWRGQARQAAKGALSPVIVPSASGPGLVYAAAHDDGTAVRLREWGGSERTLYTTRLNAGALAAARDGEALHLLFAEGYRNSSEDVYDAVLLAGNPVGEMTREVLGPAVYAGLSQRYAFSSLNGKPAPVWWWEPKEVRARAALTGGHNPRLTFWDGEQPRPIAGPWQVAGTLGETLFWMEGAQFRSLNLTGAGAEPGRPLLSPNDAVAASAGEWQGTRYMAWLALRKEVFSANVYVSDTREAYQPTTLDRVAVGLGWNPWFPWESALAQTLMSLMAGVLALIVVVPLAWLTASLVGARIESGHGTVFAVAFASVVVLAARTASGWLATQPYMRGWVFEPVLTPPWWLVIAGLVAGSLLAFAVRRRGGGSEIAPVASAALIVFIATAVSVFSRAGFVRF
jgi:hypothetical protein